MNSRIDLGRLDFGNKLRNAIIHYKTDLSFPEVYYQLANLMNFAVQFYESFLRNDKNDFLISHIDEHLKREENDLYHAFSEECVYFNGVFMPKFVMEDIIEEQKYKIILIDGVEYDRIPFGDDREWRGYTEGIDGSYANELCHDCLVKRGQIHTEGCDIEKCPKCGEQLLIHDFSQNQFKRLKTNQHSLNKNQLILELR